MEVNSNLLKLKLDMVFRDLALEEAEKRFAEVNAPPISPEPKKEVKRKVVKGLVPDNK